MRIGSGRGEKGSLSQELQAGGGGGEGAEGLGKLTASAQGVTHSLESWP